MTDWPLSTEALRAETLPHADRPAQPDARHAERRAPRRRVLLLGATTLLLLWSVTCLLPPIPIAALDLVATFAAAWSPVVMLPAVGLVVLALRSRAWVVAVPAAIAGILPWVFVGVYAIPGNAPPVAGSPRVRVLLADADAGAADPRSLAAATLRQRVDVLVVTEATPLLTHALATSGLDPRLAPRWVSTPGATRGGLAVYTRYAIVSMEALGGTRWPAERITLETGGARVALVVGRVSPPGDGTARWRSDLAALADAARTGGPAVIAGTLDASPEQAPFRRLTSRGLEDAAAVLGRGLRPTWPSWAVLPLLPVDHVIVGGGVGVRSVATLPVAGTSHRALVADLVVPATGS